MDRFSWDDLRIVLAVARAGSVRAAARELEIHHATVSRRLSSMSDSLKTRPFERKGRRLIPSEVGLEMIDAAKQLEAVVLDMERRVHGRDQELRGAVRVSAGYAFLHALRDVAAQLARDLPEVRIDWVSEISLSSLVRREADIAIRITRQPDDALVGRRVSALAVGAYGTAEHAGPGAGRWVDWDGPAQNPAHAWIQENTKPGAVAATANDPWTLYELVAGGVGRGFITRVLGDACPALSRVAGTPEFESDVWVLMHQDNRHNLRVRTVMKMLGDAIASRDEIFRGLTSSETTLDRLR